MKRFWGYENEDFGVIEYKRFQELRVNVMDFVKTHITD